MVVSCADFHVTRNRLLHKWGFLMLLGRILFHYNVLLSFLGFTCGSAGKESDCNAGDLGSIPGLGRSPGEENFWPGDFHGQYSPRGCKESDMTE